MAELSIVILGAGPAGIGAGARLHELGHKSWMIYERSDRVGGLAGSETDAQGFTWDRAGHVLFSKDARFNEMLQKNMGSKLSTLERKSFIRIGDRWVAYPFQNNIRHLLPEQTQECLQGLLDAGSRNDADSKNFKDWIEAKFGSGIARLFMLPYNQKVWAHPLEKMGTYWMNDRVSVVDYEKIAALVKSGKDETAWGPNSLFFYPRGKGFGSLFQEWSSPFSGRVKFGSEAVEIDPEKKTVKFSDGKVVPYGALVTTLPLDQLVARLTLTPPEVKSAARKLAYHGVYTVGIGLRKKLDWDVCWAYFPDPAVPFYRVTHLSKYSPAVVPEADTTIYSSLLCEIPYSAHWPNPKETVVQKTIDGLVASKIITEEDRGLMVSTHLIDCPYAYPIPTLDRDAQLAQIVPWLESRNIFSRGRFGTWRYEVGNSDHAFMMGWDAVGTLLNPS